MALVVHPGQPPVLRRARALAARLGRRGVACTVLDSGPGPELGARIAEVGPDLVVSLGGDGTILAAARAVAGGRVPLLPVNMGGLGFLASAERGGLSEAVRAVLAGEWVMETRRLVQVTLRPRRGRPRRVGIAVNDAVVRHGSSYRALRADLDLDGESLGHLLADGLVVATPAGSTAYSLSAGGPLVLDGLDALLATPVCPHTLASRALVFDGRRTLTLRVASRDADITLSLDGQPGVPLGHGDAVVFTRAPETVRFLRPPDGRPSGPLRVKLGWQGSPLRRSP